MERVGDRISFVKSEIINRISSDFRLVGKSTKVFSPFVMENDRMHAHEVIRVSFLRIGALIDSESTKRKLSYSLPNGMTSGNIHQWVRM